MGNLQRGPHAGATGTDHHRIKFTSWNSHLTPPQYNEAGHQVDEQHHYQGKLQRTAQPTGLI